MHSSAQRTSCREQYLRQQSPPPPTLADQLPKQRKRSSAFLALRALVCCLTVCPSTGQLIRKPACTTNGVKQTRNSQITCVKVFTRHTRRGMQLEKFLCCRQRRRSYKSALRKFLASHFGIALWIDQREVATVADPDSNRVKHPTCTKQKQTTLFQAFTLAAACWA